MRVAGSPSADLLPERLRRLAREQPARGALAFLDQHAAVQQVWTVGELDRRARSVAGHLQRRGLTGQPVILAYPSGLEFVAAFCGCLYAGAVAVPTPLMRTERGDARMSSVLTDSGASLVLTSLPHRSMIDVQAAGVRDVLATDTLPDGSEEWVPLEWRPDHLAFLQYTSGSTRSPAGVMISHGNLAANLEALRDVLATDCDSVGVSWLPLFHDMGLIAGVLEPLWVGYPAYLMAPATFVQNPLSWLHALSRHRGTVSGGPNFAYQACVNASRAADVSGLDLSAWSVAWNGAEPVRAATIEQFCSAFAAAGFRAESASAAFGLAEATLVVTGGTAGERPFELIVDDVALGGGRVQPCQADDPHAKRIVSSGPAARGTLVCIVQPDTREQADPACVGEIWVRGDSVGQGYWQKPEESTATFRAYLDTGEGPFLRTGDLGFVHQGELFVTGRLKDVIVMRGVNYYPHDLEQTVESSHRALRGDAGVVIGVEEGGRVRLVAVHEVRRDCWRSVDADEVFLAIRRAVARAHHLSLDGVVLLKPFSIPKTSSGKVQRARCRMALQEGALHILHEWWAPVTGAVAIDFTGEPLAQPGVLERQLVAWLRRELALPHLGWSTPLLELGVDSLKGVELANSLSAAFNHSFSATLLIEHPTVEDLARLIRTEVLGTAPDTSLTSRSGVRQTPPSIDRIASMDDGQLDLALHESIGDILRRYEGT